MKKNNYAKENGQSKTYDGLAHLKIKKFFPDINFYDNEYFDVLPHADCDEIFFNRKVTDPVKFSYGNILDDFDKIDDKYPSIIFARNMWPYVDNKEFDEFAYKLYNKLAYGSTVVIGSIDTMEDTRSYKISDALINAGFRPSRANYNTEPCSEDCYVVFQK